METLVKMIADKTGISPAQATTAIHTVVGFLKDKMPAGIGNQVESFIQNNGKGSLDGVADNLTGKIGGMFGK